MVMTGLAGVIAGPPEQERDGAEGAFEDAVEGLAARIRNALDAAENDTLLERLGGGLESGISSLGRGLLNAFLDVIKYIGPAIIEGIARTYVAVRNVLEGHEVNTITAGTTVFLGLFAGIYLLNFARTAGAHVIPVVNR